MNKNIEKIIDNLTAQIEILEKKADDTIPIPEKIDNLSTKAKSITNKLQKSWFEKKSFYSNTNLVNTIEEIDNKFELFKIEYNNILNEIEELHKNNLYKIDHNKKIIDKIKLIMKTIGINDTYSTTEYTKRSYKPKSVTNYAGYLGDLNRVIVTDDHYNFTLNSLKTYYNSIETLVITLKNDIKKAEIEKQNKIKEEEKIKALNYLRIKYKLEFDSSEYDILERLLSKNEYLNLAYHMESVRNDWNDGPSAVRDALYSLSNNKTNETIIKEISYFIDNWEHDGRVFRDCEYNYGYIYSLVDDDDLTKDYQLLYNHIDIFN